MAKKDLEEAQATDLAVSPELAQMLAEAADEEAQLERPGLPAISLRSGMMSYLDTVVEGNTMDVVVLGASFERSLYTSAFDPDEVSPPDCWALSLTGNDMGPDKDYGFGLSCDSCPNNQWGSDIRDGKPAKGKRCKERRRLVVAPASVVEKGSARDAELASLKIPVTSVKNWGTYINKLRSGLARPVWSVVTNLKLVPDQRTQFKLQFDFVSPINDTALLDELKQLNAESSVYTMQPFEMSAAPAEPIEDSGKF